MEEKEHKKIPAVPMPNEPGDIGDEQCPAGVNVKTDKEEWSYSSDEVKHHIFAFPDRVREFLAGL